MESPNGTRLSGLKRKLASEPDSLRGYKSSHTGVGHPSAFSGKCNCNLTAPSLVDSCFNYLNSGVPYRVMFYNRGGWHDFPDSVTKILAGGFKNEKSSIRFSIGDEPLLLDFLSMVVINLRIRKQRSIAWIDESEKCFFPTLFSHDDNGSNEWDFEDLRNRSVQTEVTRQDNSPPEVIKHVLGERAAAGPQKQPTTVNELRFKLEPLARGTENFLSIQKQFLAGMAQFAGPGNVLFIHQYVPKDGAGQKRKETFERLIKLTEEKRGNANVQFAWFGANKLEAVGILIHGFGTFGRPIEGVLGTGLYLTPEGRSFASVNHCDVDENGMQYLILCRVILGNMEQVHPGSKQYIPSSGDYDSGVDNLSNPKCYVVWPTHLSTYICPEYIVSFKLEQSVREYLSGLQDIRYHVAMAHTSDCSTLHPVIPEPMESPTSPWVPFSVLFKAVQDHVSPLAMELLLNHYEELKNRVIDREELVKRVRVIIGDQLIISVLTRFKRDPSLWSKYRPAKRSKLDESASSQPNLTENDAVNPQNGSSMQPSPGPNGTVSA